MAWAQGGNLAVYAPTDECQVAQYVEQLVACNLVLKAEYQVVKASLLDM